MVTAERFIQFLESRPLGVSFSTADADFIKSSHIIHKHYAPGAALVEEGYAHNTVAIIISGWAVCSKALENGSQLVVDFGLRGDIASCGSLIGRPDCTVTAVTDVDTFEIPLRELVSINRHTTALSNVLLRGVLRRYGIAIEHQANLGRRGAVERTVHLLLELAHRTYPDDARNVFHCPLTQIELSDALGLSAVHVNRVLRELREAGLASFRHGLVEFHDRKQMVELAHFSSDYLKFGTESAG
ncbi:Crp/Fnr family transcriptional regulator [Mesorhizobium sp. SB112]|uniref:Crp/Fnr family transcriptional regulator n=1 Tax=Mesorhizobium sp. SB112 TaxID=3151853 RepID=UPI003264E597